MSANEENVPVKKAGNYQQTRDMDLSQLIAVSRAHLSNFDSPPCSADYLTDLLQDMSLLKIVQSEFLHVGTLLEKEIGRVRANQEELARLPPPEGPVVMVNEKIYVPVHEYPNHNFVGRLIGPRGKTAKLLESETGCKIMIRGRGSMRNKKEEDLYRGRRNYEHLYDDLHVIVSARDTENRAIIKLRKAVDEVKKLLRPWTEGEDELKNRQLMELAFMKNNVPKKQPPPVPSVEKINTAADDKADKVVNPFFFLTRTYENVNTLNAHFLRRSPIGDSSSNADLTGYLKNPVQGFETANNIGPMISQENIANEYCTDLRFGVKNLLEYMRNKPCIHEEDQLLNGEHHPDQGQFQNYLEKYPNPNKLLPIEEERINTQNSLDLISKKLDGNKQQTVGITSKSQRKVKTKKQPNVNITIKRNMLSNPCGIDGNHNPANGPGTWFFEQIKTTGAVRKN